MSNIKNTFRVIILIFIVGLIHSCSSVKNISSNKSNFEESSLTDEEIFEFKYQFYEANKFNLQGKYDLAISLYNGCLKIDPGSGVVHYKLASIYLVKKDYELAESHAEEAVSLNSNNLWYLYLAGSLYTQNNKIEKAKEAFIQLIEMDQNEIDFYFNLADVYLKDNDIKGAIGIYDDIENNFGLSEIVSLQKHKLYLSQNNKKDALIELENLSKANPNSIDYQRMIAEYYVQINQIDNGIIEYKKIIENFPDDGFSHVGLAECYRLQGDFDKSFIELKLAFKSNEIPSDVKFNMLLSIIQSTNNDPTIQEQAFQLSEILVEMYPKDVDIATIYANFLLKKGKLKEAYKTLIYITSINKDKYALWEQLILLDNEFANWEGMFKNSEEALKYFPNQSFLYFFNGFSAYQIGNYEKAEKSLSFGYKLITEKDPLAMDFLTFLGEVYYKLNYKEKCFKLFDDVLLKDPNNIMVLNNYAYYLSIDNKDLDKAEEMSKKTIDKEPNNPTYLDTYAWILFKQQKNENALIYIQKAIDNSEDISDVVFEHYGDILYHNNKVDEAVIQWNNAKNNGEGSGLLEKKIDNRKYFE